MADRDTYQPGSGKLLLDDNSVVDISDLINSGMIENLANGKKAIGVDTQSIESSHAEIITEDKTDYELIAPGSGNKLVIHDVFITAEGNVGPVEIDFDDGGDPIARLYSSQFNRLSLNNMTIKGGIDEKVVLNGGDSSDDVFVVINYVEISGQVVIKWP